MNDQLRTEVQGEWVLMKTKSVNQEELKGYWDFYGMDILTISRDKICTYSFFEDTAISCAQYAYDIEGKALNIFNEPKPWEKKINTFSVTIKVLRANKDELILLYTMCNKANQICRNVIELGYVAIRDSPLHLETLSLTEMLSSKPLTMQDLTFKFLHAGEADNKYICEKKDYSVVGKWHVHNISSKILLTLKETTGEVNVYQIEKIFKNKIYLVQLNNSNKFVLKPSAQ